MEAQLATLLRAVGPQAAMAADQWGGKGRLLDSFRGILSVVAELRGGAAGRALDEQRCLSTEAPPSAALLGEAHQTAFSDAMGEFFASVPAGTALAHLGAYLLSELLPQRLELPLLARVGTALEPAAVPHLAALLVAHGRHEDVARALPFLVEWLASPELRLTAITALAAAVERIPPESRAAALEPHRERAETELLALLLTPADDADGPALPTAVGDAPSVLDIVAWGGVPFGVAGFSPAGAVRGALTPARVAAVEAWGALARWCEALYSEPAGIPMPAATSSALSSYCCALLTQVAQHDARYGAAIAEATCDGLAFEALRLLGVCAGAGSASAEVTAAVSQLHGALVERAYTQVPGSGELYLSVLSFLLAQPGELSAQELLEDLWQTFVYKVADDVLVASEVLEWALSHADFWADPLVAGEMLVKQACTALCELTARHPRSLGKDFSAILPSMLSEATATLLLAALVQLPARACESAASRGGDSDAPLDARLAQHPRALTAAKLAIDAIECLWDLTVAHASIACVCSVAQHSVELLQQGATSAQLPARGVFPLPSYWVQLGDVLAEGLAQALQMNALEGQEDAPAQSVFSVVSKSVQLLQMQRPNDDSADPQNFVAVASAEVTLRLCWVAGETAQSPEDVNENYGAIELIGFKLISELKRDGALLAEGLPAEAAGTARRCRALLIVLRACCKLAVRSVDLISRTRLLLENALKLREHFDDLPAAETLLLCARELQGLMKFPSAAAAIFDGGEAEVHAASSLVGV